MPACELLVQGYYSDTKLDLELHGHDYPDDCMSQCLFFSLRFLFTVAHILSVTKFKNKNLNILALNDKFISHQIYHIYHYNHMSISKQLNLQLN